MSGQIRTKPFRVVFSEEEHAALVSLSRRHGVSAADVLRQLVRAQAGLPAWAAFAPRAPDGG